MKLCCCYLIQSAEDGVKADQTACRSETGKHRVPKRIQKCLSNVATIESPMTTQHLNNTCVRCRISRDVACSPCPHYVLTVFHI